MAKIKSFEQWFQQVRPHSTEVVCFHQLVRQGETVYLHLSTFGSPSRASSPKSSQSIQLDARAAETLIALLRESFPDASSSE